MDKKKMRQTIATVQGIGDNGYKFEMTFDSLDLDGIENGQKTNACDGGWWLTVDGRFSVGLHWFRLTSVFGRLFSLLNYSWNSLLELILGERCVICDARKYLLVLEYSQSHVKPYNILIKCVPSSIGDQEECTI